MAAKQQTINQPQVAVDVQDVIALVDVIEPPGVIFDATIKTTLTNIATAFLRSLNERETESAEKVKALASRADLQRMTDPKTKLVVVKDVHDANLCSQITSDCAAAGKEISSACEKEIGFFHKMHGTLTKRRGAHLGTLNSIITNCKNAAELWLRIEAEKERKRVEQANKTIEKQFVKAGIDPRIQPPPTVVANAPKIDGLTEVKYKAWRLIDYRGKELKEFIDDGIPPLALIKAVAEGKAPRECLMVNEQYLNAKATEDFAKAIEDTNSKRKMLYPGVEVFEATRMMRR